MKYFKYSIVLLMWLIIKPLAFILSFFIISLWGWLININTIWSYIIAFLPTVIIYSLLIILYIKNNFNNNKIINIYKQEGILLIMIFSLIPPILISFAIIIFLLYGFRFPNKYDLCDLEKCNIFSKFIDLIGC